jgi:predicted glycogen debranching enzyme
LYQPCLLEYSLREPAVLVASTRYRRWRDVPPAASETAGLRHAARQFFARRAGSATVVAGYPWFTDWGRDTMIALPGLLGATGRRDDAREILAQFAGFVSQGMLPNWFPEAGQEPEYNTMDASLWFFEAAQAYLDAGGDAEFIREVVYPKLNEIVHWHLRGTRYGIRLDADGMITGGAGGVQLTWMDARVGDWVVTPRRGKPVEIQALWYNALRILESLARRFDDGVAKLRAMELADLCARHFEPLFWNEAAACLYDAVGPDGVGDPSIRPNQVLAAGLRYPLVLGLRARQVVDCVERELLTPFGLRTLSPRDLRYRPYYEGGVEARDSAYHQGTAWPWLLGPFIDAYLRAYPEGRARAIAWLQPLADHLEREGQLPEIADGDAPQRPAGCFAQAWSVAELARVGAKLGLDDRLRATSAS